MLDLQMLLRLYPAHPTHAQLTSVLLTAVTSAPSYPEPEICIRSEYIYLSERIRHTTNANIAGLYNVSRIPVYGLVSNSTYSIPYMDLRYADIPL